MKWQLSGGVLEGTYVLGSFHSHWGHAKGYGCEHLLDGQKFDGETHFVFQLTPDIPTVGNVSSRNCFCFPRLGCEHVELNFLTWFPRIQRISYKNALNWRWRLDPESVMGAYNIIKMLDKPKTHAGVVTHANENKSFTQGYLARKPRDLIMGADN